MAPIMLYVLNASSFLGFFMIATFASPAIPLCFVSDDKPEVV